MSKEIKERSVIWVYELYSNETVELRTVLSRKFINEVGTINVSAILIGLVNIAFSEI